MTVGKEDEKVHSFLNSRTHSPNLYSLWASVRELVFFSFLLWKPFSFVSSKRGHNLVTERKMRLLREYVNGFQLFDWWPLGDESLVRLVLGNSCFPVFSCQGLAVVWNQSNRWPWERKSASARKGLQQTANAWPFLSSFPKTLRPGGHQEN